MTDSLAPEKRAAMPVSETPNPEPEPLCYHYERGVVSCYAKDADGNWFRWNPRQ